MKLELINFNKKYVTGILKLLNENNNNSIKYREFDLASFNETFLRNKYFDKKLSFLLLKNNKVIGFINGTTTDDNSPGYLSFLIIKKEERRKGYGTILYKKLENYFKNLNKQSVRIVFHNPIKIEWLIPNTNNHIHPNIPGILCESDLYHFLVKVGMYEEGIIDTYYFNIENNTIYVNKPIKNIESKGIYIKEYNDKFKGHEKLFTDLNNKGWLESFENNIKSKNPKPMLVVVKDNNIYGWTGPISIDETGRGVFHGIGVSQDLKGNNLGKILFGKLLEYFKELNVTYISLFTGRENIARKIYLYYGFSVVASFAIMKKLI